MSAHASHLDYTKSNVPTLSSLQSWVKDAMSADNTFLFQVIDAHHTKLVGTSKLTLDFKKNSFSIGIMLASEFSQGQNIDKYVKGALLNYSFFCLNLGFCQGGCTSSNFKSISFYKYFDFDIISCDSSSIKFSLSKTAYVKRVSNLLIPALQRYGFGLKNFEKADQVFVLPFTELPGFSSLTFFNFASDIIEKNKSVTIQHIFDCRSFSDIALLVGPSFFSLI